MWRVRAGVATEWRVRVFEGMGHPKGGPTLLEHLEPRLLLSGEIIEALPFLLVDQFGAPDEQGLIFAGYGSSPQVAQFLQTLNLNAADTTNADQLWPGGSLGLSLDGAGLTVGIWDGGYVRTTHQELTGRVTVMDTGGTVQNHATHVAGTIAATGIDPAAHGMANQVNIRSYEWTNDVAEMAAAAPSIVASNQSYSFTRGWTYIYTTGPNGTKNYGMWYGDRYLGTEDASFGKYDSDTQSLDAMLYSNPGLLSVWAASNDRGENYASLASYYLTYLSGTYNGWYWIKTNSKTYPAPPADGSQAGGFDILPQMQVAKNNLVVGAINDITADPYTSANVTMTSFSSWGPADDGRVKPDVVANGASLYSSISTSDTAYGTYSGTSMASPNVTGTATLLIEYYQQLFGALQRAATTKAALIHNAFDAGNAGPDYTYGWGVVDAAAAADFLAGATVVNGADELWQNSYTGDEWTYNVYSDGLEPIKATMVWTDPAPTVLPSADLDDPTSVLVHDLDLWITGPNGTYYPWTLNPASPSAGAVRTAANHVDNVEQVLIGAPLAGGYTLHVGRTGAAFTQDYSLLLSGAVPDVPPKVVSAQINRGQTQRSTLRELAVQFSEDVSASLTASDLTLYDATHAQYVDTAGATMTYDGLTNTATWSLSAVTLGDARYTAVLSAAGVTDLSGNRLDGDGNGVGGDNWNYSLHRLAGDVTGDAAVDVGDLGVLASEYGSAGAWWQYGADLNADGDVDVGDLGILATAYGNVLTPLGGGGAAVTPPLTTTSSNAVNAATTVDDGPLAATVDAVKLPAGPLSSTDAPLTRTAEPAPADTHLAPDPIVLAASDGPAAHAPREFHTTVLDARDGGAVGLDVIDLLAWALPAPL